MVCVHSSHLAAIVARFVCIFVVHVIRDSNLREDHRVVTHIPKTFISQELELIAHAVSNGSFTDFDTKHGRQILATEDTNDIDIVESIPIVC